MKQSKLIAVFYFFIFFTSMHAQSKEIGEEFLSGFILGNYQLIGKQLNEDKSYFGTIQLTEEGEQLIFVKTIGEEVTKGVAKIEKTIGDKVNVLRLNFDKDKKSFEQTCLVDSDLDNYARFTCHLYEKDVFTKSPGLEAFFIKHDEE